MSDQKPGDFKSLIYVGPLYGPTNVVCEGVIEEVCDLIHDRLGFAQLDQTIVANYFVYRTERQIAWGPTMGRLTAHFHDPFSTHGDVSLCLTYMMADPITETYVALLSGHDASGAEEHVIIFQGSDGPTTAVSTRRLLPFIHGVMRPEQ